MTGARKTDQTCATSRALVVGLVGATVAVVPVGVVAGGVDRLVLAVLGSWGVLLAAISAVLSRVSSRLRPDPTRVGSYRLERILGEGGMGTVHLARHAMLERPAAVKLLRPEHNAARFEREVQRTSQLEHPNIVTIYDFGHSCDGRFWYAMEYLEGETLAELVDRVGPLEPDRAVAILDQVAAALAHAHDRGLVHADIKPSNVMVGPGDRVKLVDFGLVRDLAEPVDETTSRDTITGTPLYLAPELIREPDAIDGRSDLYALGAIAFFLLTGEHLFDGNTVVEVCSHHLHTAPDRPSDWLGAPIPPRLEAAVLRSLAKDPGDRFASADEMRCALLAARTHRPAAAAVRCLAG